MKPPVRSGRCWLLANALIKADEALYDSKRTGKDKYTFHRDADARPATTGPATEPADSRQTAG